MEKSTIIGLILGITAISVGMVLKGANLSALINPAAVLIIFVGTAACLLNGFPMERIKIFPKLVKMLFVKPVLMPHGEILRLFIELSQLARREGLLALEPGLEEIKDPFLKEGLTMVIDGMDPDLVVDVLGLDIQQMEERHRTGALIFSQAGMYAPTLGVLGAVVGLVAALGNLDDIEKLGHSIAAAFIATLFGIFTGYVIWHPFSNKLKLMSKEEVELKKMMLEGILSLQAGDNPATLEAKLRVFVPQSKRQLLNKGGEKGDAPEQAQ
ncbi:flagellar motor stator protein MotA [Anaeroselena agilis]|uniref:Flagellar motor stator protein MotA n=1 Tax=Anaeroselena agilis TaxID=3063788 RepID=A0ABU3NSW4_9FIRM|nr:flagellar motor stator protein MotA [Selenomonadales bacterium 4137-cl]